jgi:TIR domain
VQTLDQPTVFLCHASADRETARAVADFLEKGAEVRVLRDEGEMLPDEDLAGAARRARMADIVIVLFSRDSLPPRWPRAQWEDALVNEPREENVRIAFFKCDDCVPPKVLQHVFERKQVRELKRWVRARAAAFEPPEDARYPDADLEWLGVALADRAGVEYVDDTALAFEFVRAYREDFDEVFVLDCEAGGRTLAALAGDLASQLGLRLEGDLEQNVSRLREFCAERRFLLILDDAAGEGPEHLQFGGRCSTLISSGRRPVGSADPLRQAQAALANPAGPWDEICRHARLGRRLTREQGRIAECYELMQLWHCEAEEQEDRAALEESAREIVWILEGWGRTEEAHRLEYRRATEFDDQMMLPFG